MLLYHSEKLYILLGTYKMYFVLDNTFFAVHCNLLSNYFKRRELYIYLPAFIL